MLFTSVGVICIALGLVMLAADALKGRDSGWRGRSLYDLMTSPWMDSIPGLDALADWLRRPRTGVFLNAPISFMLDFVPQSVALIVVGGIIVWKGLR